MIFWKFVIWMCLSVALGMGGILPRYTVAELAGRSQRIVEGRVKRAWTAWDPKHMYIWTHYEVEIAEVLKGSPAATVTVSEPGGAIDGIQQMFSGQVPYSLGEHVVLFLYRTPLGYLRTRGGPQGKFFIQSNASLTALKARIRELTGSEGR